MRNNRDDTHEVQAFSEQAWADLTEPIPLVLLVNLIDLKLDILEHRLDEALQSELEYMHQQIIMECAYLYDDIMQNLEEIRRAPLVSAIAEALMKAQVRDEREMLEGHWSDRIRMHEGNGDPLESGYLCPRCGKELGAAHACLPIQADDHWLCRS